MYARDVDPADDGLKRIKPLEAMYILLVNYRRYLLQSRTGRISEEKYLKKTLDYLRGFIYKNYSFMDEDPVGIIHFLERIANLVDEMQINERVLYINIPALLGKIALSAFEAAKHSGSSSVRPIIN